MPLFPAHSKALFAFAACALISGATLDARAQTNKQQNAKNVTTAAPAPNVASNSTQKIPASQTPQANVAPSRPNAAGVVATNANFAATDKAQGDAVLISSAVEPQEQQASAATTAPAASSADETQAWQSHIAHARALAAIGNYPASAAELVSVRAQSKDESVRDVAAVMLIGVQIRMGDYAHANSLLQECFKARQAGNEDCRQLFFALSGQMLGGVRVRLEHYREFGVSAADANAADEVRADLEGMRALLEQSIAQAREIGGEGQSMDALALIEDAATLRASLARDAADRSEWQREVAQARMQLAAPGANKNANLQKKNSKNSVAANTRAASASKPSGDSVAVLNSYQPPAEAVKQPASSNSKSANAELKPSPTPSPTLSASEASNAASAAQPVASPSPVSVGSLIDKATQRVAPSYPQTARSARIAGTVTVYLVVDEKGAVKEIQNTNGPDLLKEAAKNAAMRWRFQPTYVNGQPVRVSGFITFNFTL